MASSTGKFGTVRKLPSQRFQARYRLQNGEQVSAGTFDSDLEAWFRLQEIEVDLRRDRHFDDRLSKIRFHVFCERYLEFRAHVVTRGELRNEQYYVRNYLAPALGNHRMSELTEAVVDAWYLSLPMSEVRRNIYGFLRRAMRHAVKWGYVEHSPCNVLNTRNPNRPRPNWTVVDYEEVLKRVPTAVTLNNSTEEMRCFYREAFEIAFAAHLRLGELVALDARDFDRSTGRLTVSKQVTAFSETTATKTGQVKTIRLLERGQRAIENLPTRPGDRPLIPGIRGDRISRGGLQRSWRQAVAAAGKTDFHIHDLRHIGLTLVADTGAHPKEVAARAGHASPNSTARYLHASHERDDEIALALDRRLARVSGAVI